MNTLHYIFDPFCGWCHAATPLIDAVRDIPGLRLALHAGGMFMGPNRRTITAEWRDYMRINDRRIARLSGQSFGAAYFDGLLCEEGVVLDSAPPTTAILAAEYVAGRGMDMLRCLQTAHFVEGRRISETVAMRGVLAELGLDDVMFGEAAARFAGMPTKRHIRESRQLLERIGGEGFPTLAIEDVDGVLTPVDPGFWLGRPAAFRRALADQLSGIPTLTSPDCGEKPLAG